MITVRTLTIAYGVALSIISTIALLLILLSPARAEHWSGHYTWGGSTDCERCRQQIRWRQRQRERELRRQRARAAAQRETQRIREVRKIYRIERDDDHSRRCQDTLAVVGDQYASEQGAQQEADKAWMQTARWQYGERFMARDHAADATYECGRSSVGSVVGQIFYRCRLIARPCSAPRQRAN